MPKPTIRTQKPVRIGLRVSMRRASSSTSVTSVALWVGRAMNWNAGWINAFEQFARPFRMPDFFLLSGLFVGAVLHRPWRSYLDSKVVHYWYFLLLWTLIIVPVLWLGASAQRPAGVAEAVVLLAYKLYKPEAMLWFILMLPVYFVVTRLLARLSTRSDVS